MSRVTSLPSPQPDMESSSFRANPRTALGRYFQLALLLSKLLLAAIGEYFRQLSRLRSGEAPAAHAGFVFQNFQTLAFPQHFLVRACGLHVQRQFARMSTAPSP